MELDSISDGLSRERACDSRRRLKFQLRKPKDLNTDKIFSKGSNVSPGWEVRNGAILMTETRKTIHLPHGRDTGIWESFARGIWIPGKFCMWKPES